MAPTYAKRLQRELSDLLRNPPHGIKVVDGDTLAKWIVQLEGAEGSLFESETFTLQFLFPADYPIGSPEVTFVGPHIPLHPHVYSNGHICLSILYDGWTPALTTTSVCLSLQSMLSSCTQKSRPPDDIKYVSRVGMHASPKGSKWIFHDDKV